MSTTAVDASLNFALLFCVCVCVRSHLIYTLVRLGVEHIFPAENGETAGKSNVLLFSSEA